MTMRRTAAAAALAMLALTGCSIPGAAAHIAPSSTKYVYCGEGCYSHNLEALRLRMGLPANTR